MHITSLTFVLMLALQMVGRAEDIRGPKAAVDRFLAEYPSAVARALAAYGQMRGTAIMKHYEMNEGGAGAEALAPPDSARFPDDREISVMKWTGTDRVDFAVSGDLMKHTFRKLADAPDLEAAAPQGRPKEESSVEAIVCVGRDSGFFLSRKPDGSPPVLKDFGTNKQEFTARVRGTVGSMLDNFVRPFGVNNKKFMSSSDFIIKQIVPDSTLGSGMYRVDYLINYTPEEIEKTKKGNASRSGWFIVSPDEGWVIREAMTMTARGVAIRYRTEVGAKHDGIALPKKFTFLNGNKSCLVVDYDPIESAPTPAEEFTLTAFGLPEVGLSPRPVGSNRTPLILIGLGVLGLIAAIWLKVRSYHIHHHRPTSAN